MQKVTFWHTEYFRSAYGAHKAHRPAEEMPERLWRVLDAYDAVTSDPKLILSTYRSERVMYSTLHTARADCVSRRPGSRRQLLRLWLSLPPDPNQRWGHWLWQRAERAYRAFAFARAKLAQRL